MITDLIVFGAVAFAAVFTAAWVVSPALRAWIERPKHGFLDSVRGYDRARQDTDGRSAHSRD